MEGRPAGVAMLAKAKGCREVVMEASEFEDFVADHFGDTHTLSVPRKTFLELGGYPLGYRVCEDVHLLVRLCARSCRVGVICDPLGVYVIHDRSATRADRLRAQDHNVQTLLDLKRLSRQFPPSIRRGVIRRLAFGRINRGYALAKAGRKLTAFQGAVPTLFEAPTWSSLRALLSMLRG
jgi:hypothetical protein